MEEKSPWINMLWSYEKNQHGGASLTSQVWLKSRKIKNIRRRKRAEDFNRGLRDCMSRKWNLEKERQPSRKTKRNNCGWRGKEFREGGRSPKYEVSARWCRRKRTWIFNLALHSFDRYWLSTYQVTGTLAFILSERQEHCGVLKRGSTWFDILKGHRGCCAQRVGDRSWDTCLEARAVN